MTLWQPIETAPRDGSVILARQGGYWPCHLYWQDGRWQAIEYQATHNPTHWLPGSPDGETMRPSKEG